MGRASLKWITLLVAMAVPAVALALDTRATTADVVVLGEVHDNPHHHLAQAEWIGAIAPAAVVFEMLGEEQAEQVNAGWDDLDALGARLEWEASGWPSFDIYAPIFEAARGVPVFGAAIPRDAARAAMQNGIIETFGPDAARFGLDQALPNTVQATREAFQQAAHCNALPDHLLPMMVDIQRLRDAELARATLAALEAEGGPIVVITGNGHARTDWGLPVYLTAAAPTVRVFSLGQSEDGRAPDGVFDLVIDAPGVDRDDPCAVFARPKGG